MNQNHLGKQHTEAPKPRSQTAVSQIDEQILRLHGARGRIERIRNNLVGCSPTKEAGKASNLAEVMPADLESNLHALNNQLSNTIGEIESLIGEIEDFV